MKPSLRPLLPLVALAGLHAGEPFTIQDAIRSAWSGQSGLKAGEAMVDRARAEAEALANLRLPTFSASAGITRTDEPMMAFGTRLDQARIAQADFMPSSLNHPSAITGGGASLSVTQPLYAGGKLDAARRAGQAMAAAEVSSQSHRRQQVAYAIDQAYFGTQVAEQGLRWAEDTLKQAQETERFVQARVDQGLMLRAEGDRAKAFRASSQAGVAEAAQRLDSARSALALLMGSEPPATLATPVEAQDAELPATPGTRADLQAMRAQGEAARQGLAAAQGSLKPEVGVTLLAGTDRYGLKEGGNWTTASVGARWTFSFSDSPRVHAARAAARAAEESLKFSEQQAAREVREARRGLETAQAKIAFAKVALEASESVRALRTARHREGLLPLMEVLDAESGLAGARTLLLNSQLEWRLNRAQLALALGQPIEGVKE